MYRHGGDIYTKKIDLDFSVNINPLGVPTKVYEAAHSALQNLDCYPEYTGDSLRKKLADKLSIDSENILLTAGASQAFLAIVQGMSFETATVFSPSFYGYEYALKAKNILVHYAAFESLVSRTYDVSLEYSDLIFIANPNNPTGQCIDSDYLVEILKAAREREIIVVIDECFLTLSGRGNESMIYQNFDNVIIVKSFTKTYGIPSIRLGYLVTKNKSFIDRLKCQLPEWNLTQITIEAGIAALDEDEYVSNAVSLIETERVYLLNELKRLGYEVYDSDINFILFKGNEDTYENLLNRGILIRDCSNFRGLKKGYFRVAVKKHDENEVLIQALEQINE